MRRKCDWLTVAGGRRIARESISVAESSSAHHSRLSAKLKSIDSQILPSRAASEQNRSKEKALIALDLLGGIEPFQGVAATPRRQKSSCSFLGPRPRRWPGPIWRWAVSYHRVLFFQKENRKKNCKRSCSPANRPWSACGACRIVSSSPQSDAIDGFATRCPAQCIAWKLFPAIIAHARRIEPEPGRPSRVL